ncbi:3-hydroxyacyl-CoA dehydrogenase NAD-binding domain-containing protein [Actinomadura montaniterrae]|uniref:3-hydroxyacyl-CoA dehydrogenase n=1 Tax=Actinomadura montaniterrae TaxID=1803903 RepID=A0A6L3VXJ7_9ACTN|nr:3-hydroxyacyl-CoA dehydrogenase NAD-binding domain-containing protein [Actinomadura montaniterrae]KAB2384877.1 3-hydroxyacyl-CoA dehydrogenase [Actinomadura montaniterrae]
MTTDSPIRWAHDDGIVVLTLDDPTQSANTMTDSFRAALGTTVDRLEAERDAIRGVVITSAKKVFFAGGDLRDILRTTRDDVAKNPDYGRIVKGHLRRLETLGRPVVAAIGGAALGGGLELALAAHHRVVVDDPAIPLGLPEVTLGLLPGGGGVVRTVRMLGITAALDRVLLPGTRFTPAQARDLGLVDALVPSAAGLLPAAKEWIAANPAPVQPWDRPGHRLPGGDPADPAFAAGLPRLTANLRKRLGGANLPAPHHILAAAVEGAQVDFETALEIEARYFADLVTGPTAKNMIKAFFVDMRRVRGPRGRPPGPATFAPDRAVVLGAGMMGAGIAHACAAAGMHVVLTDTSMAAAERGKERVAGVLADAVARGRLGTGDRDRILSRITPAADAAQASVARLVIEAVFEDPAVKADALAAVEPHLAEDALIASNTSTLPITGLAEGTSDPSGFVGLHFFSPVHKMPLVEVIRGKATSDETLHRALDVVRLLKKTAIVVNDSRGFFTSRVIRTFNDEGLRMLAEGVPAPSIEQACRQAGYPTPVLQLSDELNFALMRRIRAVGRAEGEAPGVAEQVVVRMLDEYGRGGRTAGAGFYDYASGRRARLWPGLPDAFGGDRTDVPFQDLVERLLFIEAIEAVRCLDERVIESAADANVGSLLGIGYPRWTGGVLQYIDGYDGGPAGFAARARQLADAYGDRFLPPPSLLTGAERADRYAGEPA